MCAAASPLFLLHLLYFPPPTNLSFLCLLESLYIFQNDVTRYIYIYETKPTEPKLEISSYRKIKISKELIFEKIPAAISLDEIDA